MVFLCDNRMAAPRDVVGFKEKIIMKIADH